MLLDILMFVAGLALLLIGLQTFLDPVKRNVPTEVIKATFTMVAGIFLINFWYTSVSLSRGNTYNSASYR
jgi:hypothetical protein